MKFELPKGRYIIQTAITDETGKTETSSRQATPEECEILDQKPVKKMRYPKITRSSNITETEIITWAALIRYTLSCSQTIKRLSIWNGFPKPQMRQIGKTRVAVWSKKEVDSWVENNPWPTANRPSWP